MTTWGKYANECLRMMASEKKASEPQRCRHGLLPGQCDACDKVAENGGRRDG